MACRNRVADSRLCCSLYEAVKTLDAGHDLKLMMSEHNELELRECAHGDPHLGQFIDAIMHISVLDADATNPDDKKMIFELIEKRDGGACKLDQDLTEVFREWYDEQPMNDSLLMNVLQVARPA